MLWGMQKVSTLVIHLPHNKTFEFMTLLKAWQQCCKLVPLKYLNSATELPGDSVAQLIRAWQAICEIVGSSPSLSHCYFQNLVLCLVLRTHPSPPSEHCTLSLQEKM